MRVLSSGSHRTAAGSHDDGVMNRVWKIFWVVALLLLLPATAYAVGAMTAPADQPTPRRDITITDTPTPTPTSAPTSAPRQTERPSGGIGDQRTRDRRDDRVRIVIAPPVPVDDAGSNDGDDGGNSRNDGDDDGPDDD